MQRRRRKRRRKFLMCLSIYLNKRGVYRVKVGRKRREKRKNHLFGYPSV